MKYYFQTEDQHIVELPNRLNCRILPELKARQPDKIPFTLKTDSLNLADEAIVREYLKTLKKAGVNEVFANCHIAYPAEIGIAQMFYFNLVHSSKYTFEPSEVAMDELFEKFPAARGRWGKRLRFGLDPSYVTRTPETWPYIEKAMVESFERTPGMKNIFWDYEFSPFPGHIQMYPCFSDKGIAAFAKKYGISEPLTPQLIQKKYHQKWLDFSCGEVAELVKLVQKIAHKHNRNVYLYSGYQNCKNGKEYYNMDWSKVAPYVDRAYCGYGRNLRLIADTKKCLQGKTLVGGLLKTGLTAQFSTPARILRKIIDCGGVLLWYECRFDAGALSRIAEAATLTAAFEKVLIHGKRCDELIAAEPETKDCIAAYSMNNKLVLFLINESAGPETLKFTINRPGTVFKRYGKAEIYSANKAVEIEIPAGKVIVLTENNMDENEQK